MSKFLSWALLLVAALGFIAAPAMAQDGEDVGQVHRGGGEGVETALGKKGLVVETDGFKLGITTRVQFRLTYQNEVANGNDGANGRDFVNFRVRRAKTKFSGYIFEKEFTYALQLAWQEGEQELIEDAWFRWAIMQYINVSAGQHKLPWNWEEVSSSGRTLFVDRSYVNEVFNQDFAKGIWIDGKVGDDVSWLKYWVGVYNGVLKDEDDFRNDDKQIRGDSFSTFVDNEMMINLRLETHPLGDVKHSMYESRGEEEYEQIIFAIGVGVNWFYSGVPDGSGVRGDTFGAVTDTGSGRSRISQDTLAFTADGHFRAFGLSVDVAFYWRHTEFHNRGANKFDPGSRADVGDIEDTGFTFEVSYFILPEQFNVGIRFNMFNADEFWQGGSDAQPFGLRPDATEIGLSVNYYVHGDNLKLTFDILFVGQQLPLEAGGEGLDGVYNSVPERVLGGGTLGSSEADHNDLWIVRLQLQWIF